MIPPPTDVTAIRAVDGDHFSVSCTGPGCSYQAHAKSLRALHDAIWAHHVYAHTESKIASP